MAIGVSMSRITLSALISFIVGDIWLGVGFVLMNWIWMKDRGHGFGPSLAYYRDIIAYCSTPMGLLGVVCPATIIVISLAVVIYGVKRSCCDKTS